jgi:uncharacterized protein with HEPN domain
MEKDDSVYLGHMLDRARQVIGKVRGTTRADFDSDENLRLALTWLIQTIGEAARKVSPETQAAHPEIPWSRIMGMRHKLVHDYMDVDEDLVWTVATEHLPVLVDLLVGLVPPETQV